MSTQLTKIKRTFTKAIKQLEALEAVIKKDQTQNTQAHTNIVKKKYELEDDLKATVIFKDNLKALLGVKS